MKLWNGRLWARASLVACALLLGTMLAGPVQPVAATEAAVCPDSEGECTPLEDFGYCLGHAWEEYVECVDGAGNLKKIGCGWALIAEVVSCFFDLNRALK